MIIKVLGAILVLCSSTAIGFYFSSILKSRLEDLKEIKKYFLILKGDIRYGKTPLPEAIKELAERSEGNFHLFFLNLEERMSRLDGEPFQLIWEQGITKDLKNTSLTKEDKMCLTRMGNNLGYLDQDMQLNTIDLYVSQLELTIKELYTGIGEKTRLYKTMGIMAGLFLTIIMI